MNTGDKLILFDTGLGNLQLFGPTTGRLHEPEAGGHRSQGHRCRGDDPCPYRPLGGNDQDDGTSNFPNAQFYITQADFDFWTDESKPKEMKTFIDTARKNLHAE